MWKKEEVNNLTNLYKSNISLKNISSLINRSEISVYKKLKRLGLFNGRNRIWTEIEIDELKYLINQGKSIKDISSLINRSVDSIRKKINRYSISYEYIKDKKNIDWKEVQDNYNNGLTYREIVSKFKISPKEIINQQKNGSLKLRSLKESWINRRISINKDISQYKNYRISCSFKFNIYNFPDEFNLDIINEFGWYKAKNNGDNPNGISRDHMISIKYGFDNKIDPIIISHPANCNLILQKENSRKNKKISLSLSELLLKIKHWEEKYGQVGEMFSLRTANPHTIINYNL